MNNEKNIKVMHIAIAIKQIVNCCMPYTAHNLHILKIL